MESVGRTREGNTASTVGFTRTTGRTTHNLSERQSDDMTDTETLREELARWRSIADDLYHELRQHEEPVPQSVINALVRYDRQTQGRH